MARHGYLREYDEDFGRDEGRERGSSSRERERGFMFGDETERFGPEHGYGGFQGDYTGGGEQSGFGGYGDYARGRTSFTSHPDAHYLSWREGYMRELDRDYEDYCRERELRFHHDFDAWRRQRGNPPPLQVGMTQTSTPGDTDGTLELSNEAARPAVGGPDPMATATMGTTSSGRGRR
jgi:hypothetical protein